MIGVDVYDHKNRVNRKFFAPLVVNAGGIWGQGIAEYADLKIKMFPAKGALLVMGHRINKMVINRCRKPADADILVPGDTICVIGTTSSRIPYDQIDNMEVTRKKWISYSVKVKTRAKLASYSCITCLCGRTSVGGV